MDPARHITSMMTSVKRQESEKARRERFESQLSDIPRDDATVIQWKTQIANKLRVPPNWVTFPFLTQLAHEMRALRVDCYQLRRDPRRLWFYAHQVWKNLDILEQYASVFRRKLGMSENDDGQLLSEALEPYVEDNEISEPAAGTQSNPEESSDSEEILRDDMWFEIHDDSLPEFFAN